MATRYKGIARYVHIMKPGGPKGTDKKYYSIDLLIHKSDPQCAAINAEFEAAKQNTFPSGFPAGGHSSWHDLRVSEPENTILADYMRLKISQDVTKGDRPPFVDQNVNPFLDPAADGNATGKIAYVTLYIGGYTVGSNGVKAYPNGILITDEMGPIPVDAISSTPSAEKMFGDIAGGATPTQTTAPTPAPNAPTPPVPPVAPVPAPAPQNIMTAKANGATYDAMIAAGWTDELLIQQGMMIAPSFV